MSTGYHPEGHRLRPYETTVRECRFGLYHAHMICANCAEVCPVSDGECIDDC